MKTITEARQIGRADGYKGRDFDPPAIPRATPAGEIVRATRAYALGFGEGERKRDRQLRAAQWNGVVKIDES